MNNMTDAIINENEDWGGLLIKIKPEWLNPGERDIPYVVLEDRGPRILIKELPQYKPEYRVFPHVESILKEWAIVIDTDIQNR